MEVSQVEDEEMVYELWDIYEDFNEENLKRNIEYIMRREKLWSPKFKIVFPAGGLKIVDEEGKSYQYDFEVFSSPSKIKYYGTAYGNLIEGEIADMTIELKKVD
jgi:hypothetical protein